MLLQTLVIKISVVDLDSLIWEIASPRTHKPFIGNESLRSIKHLYTEPLALCILNHYLFVY